MVRRHLAWALGVLMALGVSGWAPAAEEEADKPKREERQKDPYRVILGKLTAARQKIIKEKPDLGEAYKAMREKHKQLQMEMKKELDDFYAKLRAMSPELDQLEKEKEAILAEREREREAKMAERKKMMEERRKQREKKGGKKGGRKKKDDTM